MSNDFTTLYAKYYGKIRVGIERRVSNFHLSEELAQEVFLRALTHMESLEKNGNIEAWLFTVARNIVADYYRSQRYRNDTAPELLEYGTFTEIEDFADSSAEAVDVRRTLDKLSQVERTVLLASNLEGLTYTEIAAKYLKKSRHMAHYHIVSAKKHFQEVYNAG